MCLDLMPPIQTLAQVRWQARLIWGSGQSPGWQGNVSTLELGSEAFRYHNIVYAPADVPRSGIGEGAPPGIIAIILLEQAERVNETSVNKGLEAFTLFARETILAFIGLWIG